MVGQIFEVRAAFNFHSANGDCFRVRAGTRLKILSVSLDKVKIEITREIQTLVSIRKDRMFALSLKKFASLKLRKD